VETWAQEVKNTYKEYTFYAKKGQIDNNGNVYVLALEYNEP
jgi:hypothetical protein